MELQPEIARPFLPLLQPKRYKGAYGGRGGAKSHFFAEYLIIRCWSANVRAVCIREVQRTIKDSVQQLLADKIQKLGLGQEFDVLESEIRCRNGSNIIFRGMQAYNSENIKSLEAYDIAWIEEAQTLSERSWRLLRPTIRKPGSEIWASWNPRFRSDPVDKFFRKRARDNAIAVSVSLDDNPWPTDELLDERAADLSDDPEMAGHVWGGGYEIGYGAILARLIDRAEKDGRIGDHVTYDPDGPGIEISSDIGRRDTATWWFWQRRVGGSAIIDYDRDSGLYAGEWCKRLHDRLKNRDWPLGRIWLPHDARARTFNAKYTAVEQFITHFGGDRVGIVPSTDREDRVNAARTFVARTEFHATNCAKGIEGLRAWQYEWNDETQSFSREPLHDWACFVAGTPIETINGPKPIETIQRGDMVATPAGPRCVDAAYVYRATRLVEIGTADGRRVICTPNHKLFTQSGLVAADALAYGDALFSGREPIWQVITWISRAGGTTGIHEAITASFQPGSRGAKASGIGSYIGTFGHRITGLFRLVVKSITPTRTVATMILATSNASRSQPTSDTTGLPAVANPRLGIAQRQGSRFIPRLPRSYGATTGKAPRKGRWNISRWLARLRRNGTPAMPGGNGTRSTASERGKRGNRLPRLARYAVRALLRIGRARNTAGRIVVLRHFDADTLVYDLNVRDDHCFIAGGVLSSNSHDGDGYSYGCQVMQGLAPPKDEPKPEPMRSAMTVNEIIESKTADRKWA